MTEISTLVLVDGSSYLYRAFHALPPLVNTKGQPTGAVYGVVNMLKKLMKDYPTPHIAVIFDPKGPTFRDALYPEYKAHRPAMPDDLRSQIQPLFDIIEAMGFPLIVFDGMEADDVIGTLAQQAASHKWNVIISTGDKDMAQLVDPYITLVNTMTNTVMDRAGVIEKFGVPPELIIDYLTLIGDAVDNVPGVPKVGPKTAVKWLQDFGNLDAIMQRAAEVGGKVGENLRESLHYLPLSRQLVTIKTDVALPFTPESMRMRAPDNEKLQSLFSMLEFRSFLQQVQDAPKTEPVKDKIVYDVILDKAALDNLLTRLQHCTLLAVDTETTSLNYMVAELVGISFALEPHAAVYIPLAHDYLGAPTQLDRKEVLALLKPILENASIKKVGHNLKYDASVFANYDISLQGITYDTMLESFILSSGGRNDLDTAALKYLNYKTTSFEEIAGKGAKQLTFNQVAIETAGQYAAEDADISLQLHHDLWPKIEYESGLKFVFTEIEMPLVPILSQMERTGVLVDAALLKQQSAEIAVKLTELEQQVFALAGSQFNLSSPKQLQEILFEKMQLPVIQRTPTGQPSTAEEVLQELALDYPLPALILNYRSLSKLKSTYTDKLPEQVNPTTGRVHTSYHQAGAATGRFSSTDPNLQNIPIRTKEGRRIRQAFIAPPGYKIVSADYSQIELRIMAHLSGDAGLIQAFANGKDIHQATAAEVLNIPIEQVTSEQRRQAKAINFGLIYGMSAFGLSKQLGVDRGTAQRYMDLYFSRYPRVHTFMDDIRVMAHQQGYIETLFGRRLYLADINSRNQQLKKAAERAAVNAPMQGTAADIIKRAMIAMAGCLKTEGLDARMIMQVHDELVFEVAEAQVARLIPRICAIMEGAAELAVSLVVDVGVGSNWDEAHE
jgi:DNA polymerase-1